MGTPGTRTIARDLADQFPRASDAWARRLASGGCRRSWRATSGNSDTDKALDLFGDWTDRVKAGELPFAKPKQPKGMERNVIITTWEWAHEKTYLHDAISTDRRNPAAQCQRQDLRLSRSQHRRDSDPRPGDQYRERGASPVRDPKTPNTRKSPFAGIGMVGRQADLEQPEHRSQRDVGRERACRVDAAHPATRRSRVLWPARIIHPPRRFR